MRVLNVETLVQEQSQKHKERLLSQFTRLLDSSPSFPIYYSIDNVNSTAEIGSRSVMEYVGPDSPVRFKKIKNLPLYALQPIDAQISYDEELGTYTEYEGEGLMLQSLLQPLPGDHFILPDFNPEVIFVVTNVVTRAVRGEDHYVITFSLIPTSRILNIEKQVVEDYTCIFRNIGTEDNAIIKTENYNLLEKCLETYAKIVSRYLDENYDDKIAYLKTPDELTSESGDKIGNGSCKFLIKFLMENRILYFDEILETIFAFENPLPFEPSHNKQFHRTFPIQKFVNGSIKEVKDIYVVFRPLPISLFREIDDYHIVQSIEFLYVDDVSEIETFNYIKLIDKELVQKCLDKDYEGLQGLQLVVAKSYNNEEISVDEFLNIIDDYEVDDLFRFYFIPYALFALKVKIKAILTTQKHKKL